MAINEEKLKELQAAVVNDALRKDKKKKENLENGMADEIEYEADALAHEIRPGSVRKKKFPFGKVLAAGAIACGLVAGSTAVYHAFDDKDYCTTICMDGTCSSSTGPGTCAFHGGVFQLKKVVGVCRTVCQDGTCSESDGIGACAFHGGVFKQPKTCKAVCNDASCSKWSGIGACMFHGGVFAEIVQVDD